MSKLRSALPILLILIFGFAVRVVGLNWDQGYHLHPDERFLTMVAVAIEWPSSLAEYFSTQSSPLNPHNRNFDFFVYGLFPILIVKYFSQVLSLHDYASLNLVGRGLSAVVDTLVILFVYKIVFRITKKELPALISAFIYSLLVLPIQLSHYFATDPYLNLFLAASLYLLMIFIDTHRPYRLSALIGVVWGLAIASKITAILFAPIVGIAFIAHLVRHKKVAHLVISGLILSLTLFVTVRVAYPYLFSGLFTPNQKLIANWTQLKHLEVPSPHFPPSVQWADTPKFVFPFLNIFYFGAGPIWTILAIVALFRRRLFLISAWVLLLFVFQGSQIIKPLRYLLPIFPSLAIAAGIYLSTFSKKTTIILIILGAVWGVGFLSIYTRPHPRVAASEWIYKNIPAGSRLSCDLWDDCLPLSNRSYRLIETRPFDSNWSQYEASLRDVEYLAISSNRTYGSITHKPDFYPETAKFYGDLFGGRTEFKKIAEFTSRPGFSIPGISYCFTPPGLNYGRVSGAGCDTEGVWLVDDFADESFTVYDHPKVTIFQRISSQVPKI